MKEPFPIRKPGGTLRFWGDWFGRPYDNFHRGRAAWYDAENAEFTLAFEDEHLTVLYPDGLVNTETEFSIGEAFSVLWRWNLYGEAEAAENRREILYRREPNGGGIEKIVRGPGTAFPRRVFTPAILRAVEIY